MAIHYLRREQRLAGRDEKLPRTAAQPRADPPARRRRPRLGAPPGPRALRSRPPGPQPGDPPPALAWGAVLCIASVPPSTCPSRPACLPRPHFSLTLLESFLLSLFSHCSQGLSGFPSVFPSLYFCFVLLSLSSLYLSLVSLSVSLPPSLVNTLVAFVPSSLTLSATF